MLHGILIMWRGKHTCLKTFLQAKLFSQLEEFELEKLNKIREELFNKIKEIYGWESEIPVLEQIVEIKLN